MILIALTILPPFLILYYIIKSDRFPEPMNMIRRTFLLGVFLCIPAGIINTMLIGDTNMSYLAGLTEESLKFTALYFFLRNKIDFNDCWRHCFTWCWTRYRDCLLYTTDAADE